MDSLKRIPINQLPPKSPFCLPGVFGAVRMAEDDCLVDTFTYCSEDPNSLISVKLSDEQELHFLPSRVETPPGLALGVVPTGTSHFDGGSPVVQKGAFSLLFGMTDGRNVQGRETPIHRVFTWWNDWDDCEVNYESLSFQYLPGNPHVYVPTYTSGLMPDYMDDWVVTTVGKRILALQADECPQDMAKLIALSNLQQKKDNENSTNKVD